ncbi:unnamed protein product, partial [marine sediment metagenome]
METNPELYEQSRTLGREFVVAVTGRVEERSNKNLKIPTGEIEIVVEKIQVLNKSEVPPFTIEDDTDGGEELRMKYRYLDLRRNPLKNNMILRHRMTQEVRKYLDSLNFIEIETPVLIKSTPEGARDFVVPSRMNPREFYALPQSPQTFKQLLMVAGFDRYFQLAKCFRDEDLRADRQPEFTQIDCEMAFVERDDVLAVFEGLTRHLFKTIKGIEIPDEFPKISYDEALEKYGTDKPDTRFEMKIVDLTNVVKGKGFKVFDEADYVGGICATDCGNYSGKQLHQLTDLVKKPQIGAKGLVYVKLDEEGIIKSSVDKFFSNEEIKAWVSLVNARRGDLILILAGGRERNLRALSELRLEMGERLGLRDKDKFSPLWVVDFPLLEMG